MGRAGVKRLVLFFFSAGKLTPNKLNLNQS